ncbi:hypothetical protein G4G28_08630 [Massilia sp. Dwa41.01b]|uniref:hypothetical protein n=1 Tax=unclassified Massilia TaxID=2609279 RepID=UPI001601208C|nr:MULTISPECIES: hypothetical protein [unclassified Massilia]QNA88537.1 hypothetical protein G4G28_08630 [Massilia sp. Dwa41.01b]QNA99436.1 hypothetical protein G4G31_12295 [Massilia sp. Se16.2.3]
MKRPGTVTLRFTSRWPYNPMSLLIATFTGSRFFSHVVTIIGERAYEASMTHGCRGGAVAEIMQGVVRYRDMQVEVPDIDAAIAFAEAQNGKPYDFGGAFALPLLTSDNWNDDSKWWCSELVFATVMAGGVTLLDPDEMHRVTPNDLYQCFYPKGDMIRA